MSSRRRFGSVRSANSLVYGDKALEDSPSPLLKKQQSALDSPESPARSRELYMARRDISRYRETRTDADLAKEQAQIIKLYNANKVAKDLSSLIEESNTVAIAQTREIEALRKPRRRADSRALVPFVENSKIFEQVMRELQLLRQEVSDLKLDMANVLEEKSHAEKQADAANEKLMFYTSSAEAIRKEIEEADEEQLLVELARIEALKEIRDIFEVQRQQEADQQSSVAEETMKKVREIKQEMDQVEQVETKLSETLSNVDALHNKLELVKGLEEGNDQMTDSNRSMQLSETSYQTGEDSETSPMLQSITEELEAAKKELAAVKEEGSQYMASMDVIRNEMKHITDETTRIKTVEEKADSTVQSLNSKLLRAKAKLEAVSASEEKANTFLSSLCVTLQQLKVDVSSAKKHKELASEEAATIKSETLKIESEIDVAEERLEAAMQELQEVKSSETLALENLKTLVETNMCARASAAQSSSSISISKFEYEYLTGRALVAEEIADKKVASAQAWIEAIKASEEEILTKIDLVEREMKETTAAAKKLQDSSRGERLLEGQATQSLRQKSYKYTPGRSRHGSATPSRRASHRVSSASPGSRDVDNLAIQKKK